MAKVAYMDASWAEERREQVRKQAERQQARKDRESAEAQEFLDRFVAAAQQEGLVAEPLMVRGYGGKGHAATPYCGWYLKQDRSVAVDTDGHFYLLIADLSLRDRFRGVTPTPSAPPLILGAGGRDGESIDLTDALTKVLPGWRHRRDQASHNND